MRSASNCAVRCASCGRLDDVSSRRVVAILIVASMLNLSHPLGSTPLCNGHLKTMEDRGTSPSSQAMQAHGRRSMIIQKTFRIILGGAGLVALALLAGCQNK